MPSTDHEVPLELFRNRPALAPELLHEVFDIKVPDQARAWLGSETFTDCDPTEYRSDATIVVGDPECPELAIVLEMQLRHDKRKSYTWPVYLATLRARQQCPVTLLVLCPDAATATACAQPIDTGHPEWVLKPLVVDLTLFPAVTDPDRAREMPELTVLSTLAHADGPDGHAVLRAFCAGMEALTDRADIGSSYHDYVVSRLSADALRSLEEIVTAGTYEHRSAFAREHYGKGRAEGEAMGRAEGEAEMILVVLAARDLSVSDDVRARITSCTDLDQLKEWGRRAVTVDSAEGLFS